MLKRSLIFAFFLVVFLLGGFTLYAFYCKNCETNRPEFSRQTIVFEKKESEIKPSFDVERALTPKQQEYGLMFKRSMGAEEGMLFVFSEPQRPIFWMKNTFIPLDIIFIKKDGEVSEIVQAKALDLTHILPQEDILYVLELNKGEASKHRLEVGDHLVLNKSL